MTEPRTTAEQLDHLEHDHGLRRGAFLSSNFPGYVDEIVLLRARRDAFERLARDKDCATCADLLETARPGSFPTPSWVEG